MEQFCVSESDCFLQVRWLSGRRIAVHGLTDLAEKSLGFSLSKPLKHFFAPWRPQSDWLNAQHDAGAKIDSFPQKVQHDARKGINDQGDARKNFALVIHVVMPHPHVVLNPNRRLTLLIPGRSGNDAANEVRDNH